MEKQIKQTLANLGILVSYKGNHYLQYALKLCLEDDTYLFSIYKRLYVDIAKKFHSSCYNVERCIRTAVACCWNYGNRELLSTLAGYTLPSQPTNSEFISILYQHLDLQRI